MGRCAHACSMTFDCTHTCICTHTSPCRPMTQRPSRTLDSSLQPDSSVDVSACMYISTYINIYILLPLSSPSHQEFLHGHHGGALAAALNRPVIDPPSSTKSDHMLLAWRGLMYAVAVAPGMHLLDWKVLVTMVSPSPLLDRLAMCICIPRPPLRLTRSHILQSLPVPAPWLRS